MSKKGISKAEFRQVTTLLKQGADAAVIAETVGIKASTVKAIKQVKTWPGWERRKTALAETARNRNASVRKLEKVVKGTSARPELVTNWNDELFEAYRAFEREKGVLVEKIEYAQDVAAEAQRQVNDLRKVMTPAIREHNKAVLASALYRGRINRSLKALQTAWRTR